MLAEIKTLASLDKSIHEPARLAILSILNTGNHSDFLFLQNELGLTKGNLSSHLSDLEKMGYVRRSKEWIEKDQRKKVHTMVYITDHGKKSIKDHWSKLDPIIVMMKELAY